MVQAVSPWPVIAGPEFYSRLVRVGFTVNKVAMGQVASEYFGLPLAP